MLKIIKRLLLFLYLIPIVVFANDYAPFENVEKSGNQILITFSANGLRFNATYKNKNFITSYGQQLNMDIKDELVLTSKHAKFIVTVTPNDILQIQHHHTYQGSTSKETYEIKPVGWVELANPNFTKD